MDIPTTITPQAEKVFHQTRRTRIKGLDKLRGFAILCMLFLHGFQFFEGDLNAIAAESASNPIASVIKFMGRWAGIFVIISGFVNGSSIIRGIREGRKTPRSIWKELGVIGIWFVVIEHLIVTLFVRTSRGGGIYGLDEGPYHYSLFTGLLETGALQTPSPYSLLFAMSAISGLGYSLIILGIVFSVILKNNGTENIKRVILILSIGGTFFVALSPQALLWLRPMWIIALETSSILKTLLLGLLIADTHPLFPLLGYMFYGAALGVCFEAKISRVEVIRLGGMVATAYTFMGALLFAILGDPPVSQILQTTPIQVTYLQFGLMLWLLLGIYWFTMGHGGQTPSSTTKKRSSTDSFLERFGKTSLTIYLIEGFIGSVIKVLILDPLFPGWAMRFSLIVMYSLALICLWSFLLVYWQKSSYKYSLEWITVVFIKPLAQK
ncbi:MAG: hypothetical protein ACTSVZ_02340 [Promethearchaeota archaeon]